MSDFRIFVQSLMEENCDKSRTSDDIEMKPEPVATRDKKQSNVKNLAMASCWEILTSFIFPFYEQFGEIRKPDFGRIICKTYIFINSSVFFLQKLKTELKSL